jgi:dipeptidyl aminopeptidase/acylaminoacyl peptidase
VARRLNEELPALRAGWDARAMAALSDIHPRRHPNLVTYIIVAALLLLLAAGVLGAVRYLTVEGTLMLRDFDITNPLGGTHGEARILTGDLTWKTGDVFAISSDGGPGWVSLSRDGEKMCFYRPLDWPPVKADVFLANRDGSAEVNLTAALGGVNCYPSWSPDGTMIAFNRADPAQGQMPCQAGFYGWVMSADGSDARPIFPASRGENICEGWWPDGSGLRLLVWEGSLATDSARRFELGRITADIWGRNIRTLPFIGHWASWSPDGTMIASTCREPDHVQGDPGHWIQLLLTNADGSDPRVLVEQFVSDAAFDAHEPAQGRAEDYPEFDWHDNVLVQAGPFAPAWSPSSNQIAFLGAIPFDPDGPDYYEQVEVWVYDLTTDELIRITDDDAWQHQVIWTE